LELPVTLPAGELAAGVDPLVLLAMDLTGWASLCRLSSALLTAAERDPTQGLPFEQLTQHTAGLIGLTGGARGAITRLVEVGQEPAALNHVSRLRELFPDRLYVMLESHTPEDGARVSHLADLARRSRLPIAAAHDIHYLDSSQADLQRVLTAMHLNQPLNELPPAAPAPPGVTAGEALRQKAEAGARKLYGALTPEISARLEHELSVIGQRGYAPLFLIMEEILAYARRTGVPISSRGSAASSLVAHCLGLTSPDPMRLNLYFERFLNPARASQPAAASAKNS